MVNKTLGRDLGILGFLVAIAFVPFFRNYAQCPKWAVLGVGVAYLILFTPIHPTRAHWILSAILLWAVLSLGWTPIFDDGVQGMILLLFVAGAFCLGAECDDLDPLYRGLAFGLLPSVVLMAFAHSRDLLGYLPFAITYPASDGGLFGNQNWAGEAAAPVLIGVAAPTATRVFLALGPFAVLALSYCRSAWLALIAMLAVSVWRRSRVLAVGIGLALSIGVMVLKPTEESLHQRAMIWADSFDGLSVFGRGIGSYRGSVSQYGWRLDTIALNTEHAHNDALELLYELGPGLVGFCLLIALAFSAPRHYRDKLVFGALLVDGLVAFPLYEPATCLLFGVVAGHLCGARARLCRVLDHGRMAGSLCLP